MPPQGAGGQSLNTSFSTAYNSGGIHSSSQCTSSTRSGTSSRDTAVVALAAGSHSFFNPHSAAVAAIVRAQNGITNPLADALKPQQLQSKQNRHSVGVQPSGITCSPACKVACPDLPPQCSSVYCLHPQSWQSRCWWRRVQGPAAAAPGIPSPELQGAQPVLSRSK